MLCIAVDALCASYTDCTSCLTSGAGYNHTSSGTDSRCGWCSATKSCLPGITTGPTQGSCATQSWSAAAVERICVVDNVGVSQLAVSQLSDKDSLSDILCQCTFLSKLALHLLIAKV